MSNDDAVWAETTDGGLLRQLFGFYPTMHDAVILSVAIDRESNCIEMVLDYHDMVGEDQSEELAARIRLEWSGIESFEIPMERDLYSIDFGRKGSSIVTNIQTSGGFGKVVSESVEAVLIQIDPGEPEEYSWMRYS